MRPRKDDPQFGPVCACGSLKAKQARTCQPCHGRIRGYGRGAEIAALLAQPTVHRPAVAVEGELAVLVAAQATDERLGHLARNRWMVSLDGVNEYGRPMYEVIAA